MINKNQATAGAGVLGGLAYFGWHIWTSAGRLEVERLIQSTFALSVAFAALVSAAWTLVLVLRAEDTDMGMLANERTPLALGLVVGLFFALVTCLQILHLVNLAKASI